MTDKLRTYFISAVMRAKSVVVVVVSRLVWDFLLPVQFLSYLQVQSETGYHIRQNRTLSMFKRFWIVNVTETTMAF